MSSRWQVYKFGGSSVGTPGRLPKVIELMKGFAANPNGDPQFWTPAPLLAKLAAEGKGFTG